MWLVVEFGSKLLLLLGEYSGFIMDIEEEMVGRRELVFQEEEGLK